MLTGELFEVLQKLEHEVRTVGRYRMARQGFYYGALAFAFVKSYEFCRCVCESESEKYSFFLAASLRGICEDYITLKYLAILKRGDRDSIVRYKMLVSTAEACEKQSVFFEKYRPFQPVLPRWRSEVVGDLRDKMTCIGASSGLWGTRGKLPPVEQMAAKVALKPLYEYLYALTSEVVHFNARIAFRSAWGKVGTDWKTAEAEITTANFASYYRAFCQVYSIDLFVRMCKTFKRALGLSAAFMDRLAKLRREVDRPLRWPEAVTFEEMNLPVPFFMAPLIVRVALENASPKERNKMLRRWRREKSNDKHN